MAHPERHRPRWRRKPPIIENPTGEAIGPWNDDAGSAAEDDDYEKDGFVLSDGNEGELDNEDEPGNEDESGDEEESGREGGVDGKKAASNEGYSADHDDRDSGDLTSSDAETTPARRTYGRRRRNVVLSDDSESDGEEREDARTSARMLGRRYRVEVSEDEVEATARKPCKQLRC